MTQKLHAYNEYTSIKTYVTNVEVINQERCHLQETNTIKFMAAEREGRNEITGMKPNTCQHTQVNNDTQAALSVWLEHQTHSLHLVNMLSSETQKKIDHKTTIHLQRIHVWFDK